MKNELINAVKNMSQSDIELLLSVLEVELKERYYAENPEMADGEFGVYMPMDEFEMVVSPSEYLN